jgi:peptidoglycan/LPS O-acetylase OafA/YrhL
MQLSEPQKNGNRLNYLDSVRGIAAVVVVLFHCRLAYDTDTDARHFGSAIHSLSKLTFYFLGRLLDGRCAVVLFFVLSGFVLSLSLLQKNTLWEFYAIKRFFRIYPAFLFAVLASFGLHLIIGTPQPTGNSWWMQGILDASTSWSGLAKHLFLLGNDQSLDEVIWTLVYEMRISLLLPLILYSVIKYDSRAITFYFTAAIASSLMILSSEGHIALGYREENVCGALLTTVYFIPPFAMGAWVAINRKNIATKVAAYSIQVTAVLWGAVFLLLFVPIHGSRSMGANVGDFMNAIGAAVLICLLLGRGEAEKILLKTPLLWLGRISYSLYLIHIPIIYAIDQTVGHVWSLLRTAVCVCVVSFIVAELMVRCIESPFIRLGKRLSQ